MNNISFYKYQGTGNDFIIIDNRHTNIQLTELHIKTLCHRRFGIGADGLMKLNYKTGFDFEMEFYNADGKPGSMCGNGGRCIVAFAHYLGIINKQANFWAPDGAHTALVFDNDIVSLKMNDVNEIKELDEGIFLNTGSPHLVVFKPYANTFDALTEGRQLRNSNTFKPGGTNVNFLQTNNSINKITTFERGVEDLTLSCGTGTVASAICLNYKYGQKPPINIITPGGNLTVEFTKNNLNYNNIYLQGPAVKVFEGKIDISQLSNINFD